MKPQTLKKYLTSTEIDLNEVIDKAVNAGWVCEKEHGDFLGVTLKKTINNIKFCVFFGFYEEDPSACVGRYFSWDKTDLMAAGLVNNCFSQKNEEESK